MGIFRKGVKREMIKLGEKTFNILVVLALLLQPVGTVGLYGAFSYSGGIAIAADEIPDAVVAEEPAEEGVETVVEIQPEEVEVGEETAPAEETETIAETPVVEEPAEPVVGDTPAEPGETEEETVPVIVETPAIVPAVDEVPVLDTEEPVVTEEETTEPTEPVLVVEPQEEQPAVVTPKTWQEVGKKATTSQEIVLNQVYVAPQNDEVTVTFTKLPEHPGTLSIEEVTLSGEQVARIGAFSRTAYDITSSMEDGTFEYVLTLPIPKNKKDIQVKYAPGIDDLDDVETVASKHVDQKADVVEVTLDHFTLFVATYGDAGFSLDKSEFVPGETVFLRATGLNDTMYYRLALDPPVGSRIYTTTCVNPSEGASELTDSYTLSHDAVLGIWGAELKEYATSNCTGEHDDIADPFTVVVPEEQQHIDVTMCHATPTDTATNGYEQLTTDDDGVMQQGHATEHSADIIPPFTVGEISFPGQNWTALGQAIWNNDCQAVGGLKAVKVVDDGSDLTAWSFQLGDGLPVQADASGEVDFGYVPVGEYAITELGVASYNLVNISGTNCSSIEETNQAGALVLSGMTTVCTFSNAVDKGSITIVKDALPDDPQDFDFTVTNMEGSSFTLDDDGNVENEYSNSQTFSGLWPGMYGFTEQETAGWELTGMNCVSSNVSLDMPVSATANITLSPGENVTCTYTNTKILEETAVCGDGIVNQESEQCDGTDGVTEGENFCTFSCALVPIYDGGGMCSEGTEKVSVGSYYVSGTTNADGISIPLEAGTEYVLEATGDYSYGGLAANHAMNRADAAYSSDDNFAGPNLLNSLFGIAPTAYYRGIHTLISDMGTGTFGIVDWGDYDESHIYPVAMTPTTDTDVRFIISDWYDTWYSGDWLSDPNKNQHGYWDNEGGLMVNVYECQPIEDKGSITIVKDAVPDDPQDFDFTVTNMEGSSFTLDDDGNVENEYSNSQTFSGLWPGMYSFTEQETAGWHIEDVVCVSDKRSLQSSTSSTRNIDLLSGENITCTFTNASDETGPVCGDGIVNTEGEQCDGTDGVTEGENFCTFSCQLIPIYDGGGTCSESTEKVLVGSYYVSGIENQDGISIPLFAGQEYILEATGDYSYGGDVHNPTMNRADAAYSSDDNFAGPNLLNSLFGIAPTAYYRGIHTLISDMGTGTFGIVDWGDYDESHIYPVAMTPSTDTDVRFIISDWYDTWYSGDASSNYNQNQNGYQDNEGGLTVNVYECQPVQEEEDSRLQLRKFNDSVSDETPGNEVTYTLEVTALEGPVDDVTVTDLPPEGFAYVAGSSEGAPFIHEYASPGIWDLGDMEAGETKTLSYKAKISGTQDDGLYKDLAFAKGISGESVVFANSVADPFVGTEVNVVSRNTPTVIVEEDNENKRVEKTKKKTQYVLGASTMLPMTGVGLGLIEIALVLLFGGVGLIVMARRRALILPVLTLLMFSGVGLMPQDVSAAGLSVRIETPEVQVQSPDFKIGFVTLDVLGRDLTVECYKGAEVVPFASYALASSFGGNSGDCQINATVMPTDGDYEFYVKAIATDGGFETVESSHVSIKLASVIPGTPYNYDRDDASCMNNITFTTADDGGKTVKVELYRSLATSFVADASSFVADQAVTSNVSGAFAIPAPGCSNDYYYALRAVEVYGNGSGFVGDKDVNVDTHTVTRNRTTTVTLPGAVTGALATAPGADGIEGAGAVQGAETVTGEEAGEEGEQSAGSVLGEMSETVESVWGDMNNWVARHWGWVAFVILILAGLLYSRYRTHQRKSHESLP